MKQETGSPTDSLPPTTPAALEPLPTPPQSSPLVKKVGRLRQLGSAAALVLVLGLGAALWWNQDYLKDWLILRSYQAPTQIAQLASDTSMTPYAQRLFYVNRPEVEQRDSFNAHCHNESEHEAAVLGCFLGDREGIYVYDVTDPRLAGIQQVTAAHEALHQAYERLSPSERTRVDGLLQAYAKTITDQGLKDKMALYQKTEPTEVVNEMHSVFGTEVASLPPALETYYKQYFANRQKIVSYHAQYRAAFDERAAQIAAYDKQLAVLKPQIDAKRQDLDTREKSLKQQRSQLDSELASGHVDAYNAGVAPYNAAVGAYRQAVAEANSLITAYNKLIDERNSIAVQEQQLIQAQDSQAL